MSSLAEQHKVKVIPWDDRAAGLLKSGDEVIIDGIRPAEITPEAFKNRIEKLRSHGVKISLLRLSFPGFAQYLDSGFDIFDTTDYDVLLESAGAVSDFLPLVDRLRSGNRRYVLPLKDDTDRRNIKILNSAGLKILVDLRDKTLNWEMLDDLITDQLLSMVKRQQLDPFTMMAASYGSPDKDLSSAYFHNPAHFVQYDAASGGFNDISEDEHYRFISSQMAKADTCAMCEGFKSCKSFLAPYVAGDYDKCRGFYRNFLDAYDIKKTKEETKKKSETGL